MCAAKSRKRVSLHVHSLHNKATIRQVTTMPANSQNIQEQQLSFTQITEINEGAQP